MPHRRRRMFVTTFAVLGASLQILASCTATNDDQPAASDNPSTSGSRAAPTTSATAANEQRLDPAHSAHTTRQVQRFGPRSSDSWFFARVRDVAVDARGRVYALDDADQTIRVFAPDGSLLRSMGRLGSGPAEFRRARWLRILGDTLWVHDPMNARLTAFNTEDGTLRENSRAGATPMRLDDISPVGNYVSGVSHEDRPSTFNPLVVTVMHTPNAREESRELLRYTRSRAGLSFYAYPHGEPLTASSRMGQMHTRQPFDNDPLWRVAPGGGSLVTVLREDAAAASSVNPFGMNRASQSARLLAIGFGGDTLFDQTLVSPATPVTDAHVRAIVDSMANPPDVFRIQGKRLTADPAEVRDSLHVPRTWPVVTEFFVGEDGTYWLRQPQPPSPVARFWRIAAGGKQLPAVIVPAGLTIHRVNADRLWVTRDDDDGVPVVELHEVVAAPAK